MINRVQQCLKELNRHHTVSRFLRLYHALVAARLEDGLPSSLGLLEVFAGYLEAQISHHRRLSWQQGAGGLGMSVRELTQLAEEHRHALETCGRRLQSELAQAPEHAATALLLEAACAWGLGAHAEAVECLQRVLAADPEIPVVHFALGLNRYQRAEQEYAWDETERGDVPRVDRVRYRARLLEAVSAFEDSLTGGPLDADANRWIALCLARAGFSRASLPAEGDQALTDGAAKGEEADPTPAAHAPITLEEIRQVAQMLKRPQSLLDWGQGEGTT